MEGDQETSTSYSTSPPQEPRGPITSGMGQTLLTKTRRDWVGVTSLFLDSPHSPLQIFLYPLLHTPLVSSL